MTTLVDRVIPQPFELAQQNTIPISGSAPSVGLAPEPAQPAPPSAKPTRRPTLHLRHAARGARDAGQP